MKYQWIDEFLGSKKAVTKDLQKDWNWIRYQIGGKMFAAVCLNDQDEPYYITLKLDPLEGDFLRTHYDDIIPGYYMNKVHWNSVKADGEVPDELLKDLLEKSYQLILNSFSKKKQKELLEEEKPEKNLTCCGSECFNCGCYGTLCKGCNESQGKVFHAPEGQACKIYDCAINHKKLRNCGECDSLPCQIWRDTRDPSYTDKQFENSIRERMNRLRR